MKTIVWTAISLLSIFYLAVCCAEEPDTGEAMKQLSRSAGEDLTRSIQELDRLREQIAAEKLPLATQLTSLEEKLASLRREHESITGLSKEDNESLTAIKAEIKARQDELSYIGNLLDEYVRNFESKVHVSELQYYGREIEVAKQTSEDTTLSISEKFTRQVAFVNMSVKRLFDAIGGNRFPGFGVDLQGSVAEGQFAMIGPVALFSAKSTGAAGIAIPQSGSAYPLIRPLAGAVQKGIVELVESGTGILPLDPSRGGALKAIVQKTSLVQIFKKGGPIMWPLLFAALLALATVIERVIFLVNEQLKGNPKALQKFFDLISRGDIEGAIRISKDAKYYVVRTLGYALGHIETSLSNAIMFAQGQELKRFRRGIPILDTVITLAPLLGLLGTVTGMMGSFSLIGGELSAPGAITGGIAEALIATAFGLGIAIISLIPFNFLNSKVEEARLEIELAATQLELLMHDHMEAMGSGKAAVSGRQEISGADPEHGQHDIIFTTADTSLKEE
jgi:biopolymer transport protein ExbB